MRNSSRARRLVVSVACVVVALAAVTAASAATTVIATGLNNPRGLTFGPDGALYVAEGGMGGALMTTPGQCQQAPFPVGPYSGGFNASISRIPAGGGAPTRIVSGLPSSQTGPLLGSLVSGVADVEFVGDQLYGLEAGAGCSHGLLGTDNTIFRVSGNGTTTTVANLSAFIKAHPVANPEPDDFEPDGTWYSMVAVRGDLYAVEPNHGEVDRISPTSGAISRVVDVSASQGHIVPTSLAYKGNFFFGNLGTFPVAAGTEKIFKLTPSGQLKEWASGLTTVVGLVFDDTDNMYALETAPVDGGPGPGDIGAGRIVRIDSSGGQTILTAGLTFPTGMTMGPDGNLYVSNLGFGAPPGAGQVVRVTTH